MSSRCAHSEAEWLRRKDRIRSLYIDEGWKLELVMKHMEEVEDFHATTQQYKKRLRKWGISKCVRKNQWADIVPEVVKRKEDGKGTVVSVNGVVIDAKRLETAVSRYRPARRPRRETRPCHPLAKPSSEEPWSCSRAEDAVVIRTPPPLSPLLIGTPQEMGFFVDLDDDIEIQEVTALTPGCSGLGVSTPSAFFRDSSPIPRLPQIEGSCSASTIATHPLGAIWSSPSREPSPAFSRGFDINRRYHMVQKLPFSQFQLRLEDICFNAGGTKTPSWLAGSAPSADEYAQLSSSRKAVQVIDTQVVHRSLFRILFHSRKHELDRALHRYDDSLVEQSKLHRCLLAALEGIIPERWKGDLARKVTYLQDPTQAMRALFEITVYLMSNNLADDSHFDQVLSLMQMPHWRRQLLAFLKISERSIQAITNRVINQAIRSDSAALIRDMYSEGFHFDESQIVACCSSTRDMRLVGIFLLSTRNVCFPLSHEVGSEILGHLVERAAAELFGLALQKIETHFGDAKSRLRRAASVHSASTAASRECQLCHNVGTALVMKAVSRGDIEIVRLLLDKGAHPRWEEGLPKTALHEPGQNAVSLAISLGFSEIATLLQEHGISERSKILPNEQEEESRHHRMIQSGEIGHSFPRSEPVNLCLTRGDLINASTHGFETLGLASTSGQNYSRGLFADELRRAVERNYLGSARLLLDSGVDPNTTYTFSHDIAWNHTKLQQRLTKRRSIGSANPRIEIQHDVTPLQIAAFYGYLDMIDLLIEKGADPQFTAQMFYISTETSRIPMHLTPLQLAVLCGDVETSRRLLARGAEVDYRHNVQTPTPLILAAKTIDLELVKLLLGHDADSNACCFVSQWNGWTTAIQAATDGTNDWASFENEGEEIFRLLLDRGANANGLPSILRGGTTTTPLREILIHHVSVGTVQLALDAGAELRGSVDDRCKRTALQVACVYSNPETVERLLSYGADVNEIVPTDCQLTALQLAAFRDIPSIATIEILIKQGADVNANAGNDGGMTALQAAAAVGHVPVAQLLLDAGAKVNAGPAAKNGGTAIELAAEHGRLDMVQLLLQHGAVGDIEGWTLLAPAIDKAWDNGHSVIAEILEARLEQLAAMSFEEILHSIVQPV